ncbi:MAG TPA: sugar ABC transporter permease [Paenibacillus sp.]|uniref:carbohydrate ABC transporter permease n=1 Tax=Paenibacillus sp. TaxID=58172 RepID=UPI0028D13AD1|nr:sugar ABC transporter permease [Paenibacillus sp.]HUC91890.1 sugar ABC transporter permease [Paenibacillus sp.]
MQEITDIRKVNMKHSVRTHNKTFEPPVRRLLWPSIIFVALITQIPFLITIYYSLQDWNLMRPDKGITFSGIRNYSKILLDAAFYEVLWNTFLLTGGTLIVCLVMGLLFSLLMNRDFFGKGIVRTMLVSPFFIMPAVAGIVWKTMLLNPSFGLTAYFASVFRFPLIDWLASYPLTTIMLMIAWQWIPFFMLILLAGLQSVPDDVMEAAHLDGASVLQRFYNVILPHLLKYIEVAVLLGLIFIMQTFGEIYVTTAGGPGYASTNLPYFVYRVGFQNWDVGGASAVGVIIVVITIVLMTVLFKFLRKTFQGELS